MLATLVEEDNDAILVELCDRLEERVGVRISRATMGRIVQKLKLTRKKNSALLLSEIRSECSSCEWSIGR